MSACCLVPMPLPHVVASSANILLERRRPLQLEAGGEDITIGEEDLTPGELLEFRRALAAGQLSGLVEPWQPWWLTDAAAQLQLGPGGTALVAETGERLFRMCLSQMLPSPQHPFSRLHCLCTPKCLLVHVGCAWSGMHCLWK